VNGTVNEVVNERNDQEQPRKMAMLKCFRVKDKPAFGSVQSKSGPVNFGKNGKSEFYG
jgi:hypothetical protein